MKVVTTVKEVRDFLENGNIKNSVNFPNCDMGTCVAVGRIAICHKNIPNMISQFTKILGAEGLNIADMTNKSKGEYAYTLIDLESAASKEALDELGFDLNVIEDQEPDAALGNGGLGRLAACFLDSLATLNYAAYGCGIRYRYGMFKQKIEDGYQVEVPDNWLKNGNPFELRRPEYAKEVKFGGYVRVEYDEKNHRNNFIQENYQSVRAVPFDIPIVGYNNGVVNTLRVWDAEAIVDFQLDSFNKGDYMNAVEQENLAKNIAFKVRKTRKPVVLEPMNPYERRIIHSALQGNKYVETYSEGNEPYRHVVVVYKGK